MDESDSRKLAEEVIKKSILGFPPDLNLVAMTCCGHKTPQKSNGEYFCPWCWTYYSSLGNPIKPPVGWEEYDGYLREEGSHDREKR